MAVRSLLDDNPSFDLERAVIGGYCLVLLAGVFAVANWRRWGVVLWAGNVLLGLGVAALGGNSRIGGTSVMSGLLLLWIAGPRWRHFH